ncbi:MAG TPA: cholesterol oxidase substrate-binding domain-containing protein [Streptosporangiaceae bacterium]|nr:cholesterol oxidase substrate-binding domain-containing protein [Streptosporangiaceae bacterium]
MEPRREHDHERQHEHDHEHKHKRERQHDSPSSPGPSRRAFLAGAGVATAATVGAAAATTLGWTPAFRISPAEAATATPPPNFPAGIPIYQQAYTNWSNAIAIDNVWTCQPTSANDVVTLANWAHASNYRLRAKGMSHGWSPTLLPPGNAGAGYVLLDTTKYLTQTNISNGTLTAQTGVTMDTLTTELAAAGYGFAAIPAPGDLTLGGVLAINAHGSAIPANGETKHAGWTYGSMSNLILSLTAVVWDPASNQYTLKTFQRTDPDIRPFLAHLGRAFVTEVTMQLAANYNLRCQSWFDVPASTLFAPPASAGSSSFASYVTGAGRLEVIWFPFTGNPWLKVWSLAPSKPLFSSKVTSPYNYSFTYGITSSEQSFFNEVVQGDTSGTPAFEEAAISLVGSGLIATGTWDIWGQSQNTLLYVKPDTARIVEAGFAILTSRANIQRVVSDFYAQYVSVLSSFQANGQFPMNGPIEIRVTGLDQPSDVNVSGAQQPILSSVRPRPDNPAWDVAVWLDMGTLPVTPGYSQFYAQMESWIWSHYTGSYATVRPEWSKAWACTSTSPWTNPGILASTIPAAVSAGQASNDGWPAAISILNRYDPGKVFSSPFLDTLFG